MFESRSLIVGNPAKKIKEVSNEMIGWKTKGTALYQLLPKDMFKEWEACEPLTELPASRPAQEKLYENWKKMNNNK